MTTDPNVLDGLHSSAFPDPTFDNIDLFVPQIPDLSHITKRRVALTFQQESDDEDPTLDSGIENNQTLQESEDERTAAEKLCDQDSGLHLRHEETANDSNVLDLTERIIMEHAAQSKDKNANTTDSYQTNQTVSVNQSTSPTSSLQPAGNTLAPNGQVSGHEPSLDQINDPRTSTSNNLVQNINQDESDEIAKYNQAFDDSFYKKHKMPSKKDLKAAEELAASLRRKQIMTASIKPAQVDRTKHSAKNFFAKMRAASAPNKQPVQTDHAVNEPLVASQTDPNKPDQTAPVDPLPAHEDVEIEFEFSDDESPALTFFKKNTPAPTNIVTQAVVDLIQKQRKKPIDHKEALVIQSTLRQNCGSSDGAASSGQKFVLPYFERSKLKASRNEMLTNVKLTWRKQLAAKQAENEREIMEIASKLKSIDEKAKHGKRSKNEELQYQTFIKKLETKELEKKARQMAIKELKKAKEKQELSRMNDTDDEIEIDPMDNDADYENDPMEEDDDNSSGDDDDLMEDGGGGMIDIVETDSQRARVEMENGVTRHHEDDFEIDEDYKLTQFSQFPAPPPMSPPNLKHSFSGEEEDDNNENDDSDGGVIVSTQFRKRQLLRKLMNDEEDENTAVTQVTSQAVTQTDTQPDIDGLNGGSVTQSIDVTQQTSTYTAKTQTIEQTQVVVKTFVETQMVDTVSKTQPVVDATQAIERDNEDEETEGEQSLEDIVVPRKKVHRPNKITKALIDGEAEESEDDWMGLGDNKDENDEDEDDDENSERNREEEEALKKELINDTDNMAQDTEKNEAKNRELFMQREMEMDEENIKRAQEIVMGLRKKNGGYGDDSDDEGWEELLMDEEMRKVLYIQREKKRQALIQRKLEEGGSSWLLNNPKAQAFIKEMFDRDDDDKKKRELEAIFGEDEKSKFRHGKWADDEDEKQQKAEEKEKEIQERRINMFKEEIRNELSFLKIDSQSGQELEDNMEQDLEFDQDHDTQEMDVVIPSSQKTSSSSFIHSFGSSETRQASRMSTVSDCVDSTKFDNDDDDDMTMHRSFRSSIVSSFRESLAKDKKAKDAEAKGFEQVNVVVGLPFTGKKFTARSASLNKQTDTKFSTGFGGFGGANKKRGAATGGRLLTEEEQKVEQMIKDRLKRPKKYDHSSSFVWKIKAFGKLKIIKTAKNINVQQKNNQKTENH